jgi:hypothetical protein
MGRAEDIDDVIQEAYCRLPALDSIAHIGSGRAYHFQTTRNIVLEHVRRSNIVRIDNLTDVAHLTMVDENQSRLRSYAANLCRGRNFWCGGSTRQVQSARIFTEDGEQPRRAHMWARKVRAAIAAHNKVAEMKIPVEASAHSFRHERISEPLQIHGGTH